jgi:hypothetical protein
MKTKWNGAMKTEGFDRSSISETAIIVPGVIMVLMITINLINVTTGPVTGFNSAGSNYSR